MNENQAEVLSLRVSPEMKKAFEELSKLSFNNSKPDAFEAIFASFLTSQFSKETKTQVPAEETTLKNEATQEKEPIEEFKIGLNPVQMFAIQETILKPGFIDEMNKLVDKIDNGIDDSFFGNDVYSGIFANVFNKMETDNNDPVNKQKNIAAILINLFMSSIITNSEILDSPVTKKVLKLYINEQKSGKAQE